VRAAGLPQPAICVLLSPTVDHGLEIAPGWGRAQVRRRRKREGV